MEEKNLKVCVTGGASYLGSALVQQLLIKGYTVHATLRNFGDKSKVELLRRLPGAESRLVLFQADIYTPDDYEPAIQGCGIVFHVATPLQHSSSTSNQYKDTTEAAVAGVRSIAESCLRSETVKRLIYTASIVGASPLKDDVTAGGYNDFMDENCWTPLHRPFSFSTDSLLDYTRSKTLSEKEILKYGGEGDNKLEVISLACGLVGGNPLQYYYSTVVPESLAVLISQNLKHKQRYECLRFLEELNGKIPIVHIQDVTSAHIFCMENSSLKTGRFLCAAAFLKSSEIATLLQKCQPHRQIHHKFIEDSKREIKWGSSKLEDFGFEYKYEAEFIVSDSLEYMDKISGFHDSSPKNFKV